MTELLHPGEFNPDAYIEALKAKAQPDHVGDILAAATQGPVPTIGRIVHYRLRGYELQAVNMRRHAGAQGTYVLDDDVFPAMIVKVWPGGDVNLRVFLDGPDTYWATSVKVGEGEGTFSWPVRQ